MAPDDVSRDGLRRRVARGGVVNVAFISGAEALVLVQGLLATALLGPSEIGLYGIVSTTALMIVALRRLGIDEAFVATDTVDEETEFQHAFSVDLAVSLVAALLIAAVAPLLALVFDEDRLLALTLALAYLPVAFAAQAPQWIFFKRMDFVRLRILQAIIPLGSVLIATPLLLAGVGIWALFIGPFCGNALAIVAGLWLSPYPLAWRPQRAAARRYARFSAPVLLTALATLGVAQGTVLAFGIEGGLAAAGLATLAVTLTRYLDRVDQIVATTIYPAAVALRGEPAARGRLFVIASGLGAAVTVPAAVGLALFADALIVYVLGDAWRGAVALLAGLAVITAVGQLAYPWFVFLRADLRTTPQAWESAVGITGFVVLALPGLAFFGVWGFLAGRLAALLMALVVRAHYVRQLAPWRRTVGALGRSIAPAVAAAALVCVWRTVTPVDETGVRAAGELAAWVGLVVVATLWLQRPLLTNLRGALGRGRVVGAAE